MYVLQPKPDEKAMLYGSCDIKHPLATLKDESGGIAQIVEDDDCLLLLLKTDEVVLHGHTAEPQYTYRKTYYWFREAVEALKKLDLKPSP